MAPADWNFTNISDLCDDNDATEHLQDHLKYLSTLKSTWRTKLVVPRIWMSVSRQLLTLMSCSPSHAPQNTHAFVY